MNSLALFENKGQILVSSRVVAQDFRQRHDNLVVKLLELIKDVEGSPKIKDTPVFLEQTYIHEQNNQKYNLLFI